MILVDLNQVLLAGLMAQINSQKGVKLEENLVRHMVLNIIRTQSMAKLFYVVIIENTGVKNSFLSIKLAERKLVKSLI
jgi:hypothetical protein